VIEQQGRVVSTRGGRAVVRLGGQSGCPACDAGKGCGAGVFGRLLKRDPVELEIANPGGVRPGDAVSLGIPENRFLFVTTWLFTLPLLAGLAGALGVSAWLPDTLSTGWRDGLTALGAVLAAALAWRIAHSRLPRQVASLGIEMKTSTPAMLDCRPVDHH